jgi:hypothetical protein
MVCEWRSTGWFSAANAEVCVKLDSGLGPFPAGRAFRSNSERPFDFLGVLGLEQRRVVRAVGGDLPEKF